MSIKVLIADDQPIVRTGLTMLLDAQPDIDVVGAAADGREAVRLALDLRPDVGLFDIRMPLMDGIALALAAKQQFPELTIMLMTGYAEQRERAKSLESIVAEVMAKPFTIAELRATVLKVIEGSIG